MAPYLRSIALATLAFSVGASVGFGVPATPPFEAITRPRSVEVADAPLDVAPTFVDIVAPTADPTAPPPPRPRRTSRRYARSPLPPLPSAPPPPTVAPRLVAVVPSAPTVVAVVPPGP